jgi:vacuolar-type H+-ATPase subunit C/Vma6
VTGAAQFAFANARVRAMKSRLLRPEDAAALRGCQTPAARARVFQELVGVDGDDFPELSGVLFSRLVADYGKVLRSYPTGSDLFLALLRLHEVENLKLGWRALAHGHPGERWLPYWQALGPLEILKRDRWQELASLRQVVGLLRGTPYAEITATTFRSHEADPAAAELAFDHWGSTRLLCAAQALPSEERTARELVLALVRERDLDALHRGVTTYGLAPDLAIGCAVLLPTALRADELAQLMDSTLGSEPLWAHLPRRLVRDPRGVANWSGLRRTLRHERGAACRRAFMQQPFQLGPAVAFLLLREEEVRSLIALAEAQGEAALDNALNHVLAASMMGT